MDYDERRKFLLRYVNRKARLKTIHNKAQRQVNYMNSVDYSKYHRLVKRIDEDKLDSYKDRFTKVSHDAESRLAEIKPLIDSVKNEKQHEVLVMRYIDGLSVDEIAVKRNCTHHWINEIIRDGIMNIVE